MVFEATKRFFRILSNDTRIAALAKLAGEKDTGICLIDLAKSLDVSSNTLNHHLIKLMQNEMVVKKSKHYHITEFGLACLSFYRDFEKLASKMYKRS